MKPGTFTQMYVQLVFAVKNRDGGFTYSRSQINDIYQYIENQENHHKKKTFRDEYSDILIKNQIEFDQQFLFDFWEDSLNLFEV